VDSEDATRPLERTEATRPLTRTAPAQSRRGRMEPVQEAPPARARREPPAGAPAPARRPDRTRPPQKRGAGLRRLVSLLLLVAGVAAGAVAYTVINDASERGVQLKEQVQGDVEQTVQEIQDLIEDNVR
jgi:hypothetical protein